MALPRRALGAALIALALAGCASAPPPGGGAPPGAAGEQCGELQASARESLAHVVEGHQACSTAADCVTVSLSAACFDACSRTMSASGEPALRAARADVEAKQCARFASQGCKSIVPPCAPPQPPACSAGRCGP